jgi:hypothetical protein
MKHRLLQKCSFFLIKLAAFQASGAARMKLREVKSRVGLRADCFTVSYVSPNLAGTEARPTILRGFFYDLTGRSATGCNAETCLPSVAWKAKGGHLTPNKIKANSRVGINPTLTLPCPVKLRL